MRVRVILVNYNWFKPHTQTVLKDDNIELVVTPVKGDKIFIDGVGYHVIQRDIHLSKHPSKQRITLFVEKSN